MSVSIDNRNLMRKQRALVVAFVVMLAPLLFNGFYNREIALVPFLYWIVEGITWVIGPLLLWCYLRSRNIRAVDLWIQFRRPPLVFFRDTAVSILAGIALAVIYTKVRVAMKTLIPENHFHRGFEYSELIPDSRIGGLLVLFYFSLTAGVVEELYFRGILRRICEDAKVGKLAFVLLSSFLFSIIHWEGGIYNMFATAAYGMLIAVWFLRSDDLVGAMVAHTVSDLILFS